MPGQQSGGGAVGEHFNQEVRAAEVTGTGEVLGGPAVVTGVHVAHAAGGGAVSLKDGGSGGTTRLALTMPAAAGNTMIPIPGGKMTFGTDIYATLAAGIDSVTVFYR